MNGVSQTQSLASDGDVGKEPAISIAIVGCGPRGLYCLERLLHSAETQQLKCPLVIDIYEPAMFPGAGLVYDCNQPHFLRMNFANRYIDARHRDNQHFNSQKDPCFSSFLAWSAAHCPKFAGPKDFAPRAIVGEYLNDCFNKTFDRLNRHAAIRVFPAQVEQLTQVGNNRWQICSDGDARCYGEVVLTVGHEGWRTAETVRDDVVSADIDGVFPTQSRLSSQKVPPGATVAVRGFGLTWIDAALALTEGRGGRFEQQNGSLRYERSGAEPAQLIPFSRTGRPMLAKPVERYTDALSEVWRTHLQNLQSLSRETYSSRHAIDFIDPVWSLILNAAEDALIALGVGDNKICSVSERFEQWCNTLPTGRQVIELLRGSLHSATGNRPVDELWVLGEAWRKLYPGLVQIVSHGGLTETGRQQFAIIAVEMERIAFGPPAENVARILALHEAGLIQFDFVTAPDLNRTTNSLVELRLGTRTIEADLLLDGRIPGPLRNAPGGLVDRLANELELSQPFRINRSGNVIRDDETVVSGLAIFGRSTEASVLGNDTLSRRLHCELDHWIGNLTAVRKREVV